MARGSLRIYLGAAPGWARPTRCSTRAGAAASEARTSSSVSSRPTAASPRPSRSAISRSSPGKRSSTGARHWRSSTSTLCSPAGRTRAGGRARAHERARVTNEKRWQDIDELLEAGIGVISTVNIQHLESLNDVVEQITGVKQQETVPDEVVRRADQLQLVDLASESIRATARARRHLPGGAHRRRAGQLLPAGKPDGASRACAPLGRGPGRRGPPRVPRAARHRARPGRQRSG